MNPNRPAVTPAERLSRARIVLMSLGLPAAVGYARRCLDKSDQLELVAIVKVRYGVARAAEAMRVMQFSIEAALLTLCGHAAVERYAYAAVTA